MTSASALIVLLVGTVVGALVGLFFGGLIDALYLALLAGFLASITGAVVRSLILARGAGIGPDDRSLPGLVTIYAAVASLGAGSLARIRKYSASHFASRTFPRRSSACCRLVFIGGRTCGK